MSFEIGEEILCVRSNIIDNSIGCLKGNQYLVLSTTKCSCGVYSVNIGATSQHEGTDCSCGKHINHSILWLQNANRFVRKSSATQADEMLNIITKTIKLVES